MLQHKNTLWSQGILNDCFLFIYTQYQHLKGGKPLASILETFAKNHRTMGWDWCYCCIHISHSMFSTQIWCVKKTVEQWGLTKQTNLESFNFRTSNYMHELTIDLTKQTNLESFNFRTSNYMHELTIDYWLIIWFIIHLHIFAANLAYMQWPKWGEWNTECYSRSNHPSAKWA